MTVDIGNIIIDKIKLLPFIDKYSGVIKPLSLKTKVGENKFETKKYPIGCQVTAEECEAGQYKDLVPDDTKKSVLYLEDRGVRFVQYVGSKLKFKASYDLVCWLNLPKLGSSSCSYSAIAIAGIISKFKPTPFQSGIYQQTLITITGQSPKGVDPFMKYSYDETVTQHLMHPFDYFVLQIDVDFMVDKRCVSETALQAPINC